MKVLVLQGPSNSGKTTTIRLLVEKLLDSGEGQFIKRSDKNRFDTKVDFSLPLLYCGHLIAITTYGDGMDLIRPFYEQYKDYAAVIVFAAHPNGSKPSDFIHEKNDGKNIITVSKQRTVSEGERRINDNVAAEALLDEIKKILG